MPPESVVRVSLTTENPAGREQWLLSQITHELNNLLGPLVILPEILLRHVDEDHPFQKDLKEIADAAQRVNTLAGNLSLLGSPEARPEPLDLNFHIRRGFEKGPAGEKLKADPRLHLNLNLASGIPPVLLADVFFEKLLEGLVENASETAGDDGRFFISTRLETLEAARSGCDRIPPGTYAVLTAGDNGPIISAEHIRKIFEPFYVKRAMERRTGNGLGLAVAYRLARRMGAYAEADSGADGNKFRFYFPIPSLSSSGVRCAVIVDDRREQRDIVCRILENAGFRVTGFDNGPDALEHLARHDADLVVLDVSLRRERDGLDVYKKMREMKPGQKTLLMTGHSPDEHVREMEKLGIRRVLKKPFMAKDLMEAVRAELGGGLLSPFA